MRLHSAVSKGILTLCAALAPLFTQAQTNLDYLHSFGVTNSIGTIPNPLIRGPDGQFYGATSSGVQGSNGFGGTLYRLDTNAANPKVVLKFGDVASTSVSDRMVAGSDGAIYAWLSAVVGSPNGALLKVLPDSGSSAVLITASQAGTVAWQQLIEASDGWLHAFAGNKIVRINRVGTGFTVIHTNQTSSFGPSAPSLLFEGSDGFLYVTDTSGGDSGRGFIYKIGKDGLGRTNLFDFGTITQDQGFSPNQLVQGSDGFLYGTAVGTPDVVPGTSAIVFRLDPNGSGYTVVSRLPTFPVTGPNGALVSGVLVSSLLEASDGLLYGTISSGDVNLSGYAFRVARDGTGYQTLLPFPATYFFFDTGANVVREVQKSIVEMSNGRLAGISTQSGRAGGVAFRFNSDGSQFEQTFAYRSFLSEGTNITARLALDKDGTLYGTARNGGSGGFGTIFKVHMDGSGFDVLYSLLYTPEGSEPVGGVIIGSDDKLYGACYSRGDVLGGVGDVFRLNKDGGGFQVLHTFVQAGGDGRFPSAPLLEGTEGVLYGTTYFGGGAAAGTVFKLNQDGSSYVILQRFTNSVSGANPSAQLLEGSDGRLYGTTETNGPAGQGVVFALAKNGTGFTLLHSFGSAGSSLRKPQGALIQGPDNTLYGTTSAGGAAGFGGVFKVGPDGSSFLVVREFSATGGDGRAPVAGLTLGVDGMLYGVTQFGGGSVNGSVFRLNTDGTVYEKLRAFSGAGGDGGDPIGALVQGPDGTLYGTTSAGGRSDFGTVFRITFGGVAPGLSLTSTSAGGFEIFWPQSATGYRLQTNPDLSDPTGWQAVPDSPILTSSNFTLPITPSNAAAFFRLIKP